MEKSFEESIILRTKNTGEYNKLVFLFSRGRGKIKAVAYGARKLKNRFGSALEPFTHGRALLIEKKGAGAPSLDQMEIIQSAFELFNDYVVAAHLYYYAEILDSMLPEEHIEEKIFRLTLEMLRGFRLKLAPSQVAAYFEAWLLKLLGLMPDYKKCFHCRAGLKGRNELYISNEGYFFCDDCRLKGIEEGRKKTEPIYHTLQAIFKNRIDSNDLKSPKLANVSIVEWTTQLFKSGIEREIKSFKNLKEIRDY